MQIGKADRRITIQEVTETRTSSGAVSQSWSTLATVWASVDAEGGSEGLEAAGDKARSTKTFTIRYRSDVTAKHRISYAGDIYDITSISEVGRRQGLEIKSTAKVE